MTVDGPLPTERGFARTYGGGYYEDAASVVEQCYDVLAYARKHDAGSAATASALDLPRSRLRTWIDDSGVPDPVHAVETARDSGGSSTNLITRSSLARTLSSRTSSPADRSPKRTTDRVRDQSPW